MSLIDKVFPKGRLTIVSVPFTGFLPSSDGPTGTINVPIVAKQAKFAVDNEIDCVLLQGTTGEWPSLTVDERLQLATAWHEALQGTKVKIMLHVGHHCLADAFVLAKHAASLRVDAVLVSAPSTFIAATVDLQAECVAAIASRCPAIPALYYHYPDVYHDKFDVCAVLDAAHARASNVVGAKVSGAIEQAKLRTICAHHTDRFGILTTGADNGSLELGARANVVLGWEGHIFRELVASEESGERTRADEVRALINRQRTLICSVNVQSPTTNYQITGLKAFNNALGLAVGPCRLPLPSIDDTAAAALLARLKDETGLTHLPVQ